VKDDEIAEEVFFGGKSVILCLSHWRTRII